MRLICDNIKSEREYSEFLKVRERLSYERMRPVTLTGLTDGARVSFYSSAINDLSGECPLPPLIIVPDEKEALKVSNVLTDCGLEPLTYPLRDFNFHNITASHGYEHERLKVLSELALSGTSGVIITTPDAALQMTMPPDYLKECTIRLALDEPYDRDELIRRLLMGGYVRTEMVDGVGQFAVRGSIVDIFPPLYESPVRIDFFDTEIDQIGYFDLISQRKTENLVSATIPPARELIASAEKREIIKKTLELLIRRTNEERTRHELNEELESVKSGQELSFIDKFLPLIYDEAYCLLDYYVDKSLNKSKRPLIFMQESNSCSERVKAYEWHLAQELTSLSETSSISASIGIWAKSHGDFEQFCDICGFVVVDTFAGSSDRRSAGLFTFDCKQTVNYCDNFELLCEDLSTYMSRSYKAVVLCENEAAAKSISASLLDAGYNSVLIDPSKPYDTLGKKTVYVVTGTAIPGFELTSTRFALLSMLPSGSYLKSVQNINKRKKTKREQEKQILSYTDLHEGDYIVHVNYGIGRYVGIQKLTTDGVTKDYIKLQYAGEDTLFIPTNQLDNVTKYIGARAEDGNVKLSKMGGADWSKAKVRAKTAAKSMAKELIKLYAERQTREGYAFSPDDDAQTQFDSTFEYEETDGQIAAIADVKRDMQSKVPMDRLICGDVGYGKTEVALRAAFKAAMDGKQTAVLVPTTILAFQHYRTFLSRMRGFPVKCEMLSSFRSAKQNEDTLKKLRRGDIDIIIGTHRLISKDVKFKDLGLVVIDEEQRFGVAQKERLKEISSNVDILTLTATPIPRTLNMAMSGIRDMSILDEAPGDRFPVQTYVLEHDEMIIHEAIRKELRRGGQVFYLHNNIDSIATIAGVLRTALPDARIAVAHGKMDKDHISNIWRDLVNGDVDILVSTTIIETGVDVPNANTLIIDNADKLGLSQLHQLRGRVGRSSRRAYAYFTYPRNKAISEIATKRLSALKEYTEFGAGFKIALRDLEIRGTGNLLGSEQHGHMDSIGYDLYIKILNEAILEEKGEVAKPKFECSVDVNFDAYIPERYIKTSTGRMEMYKKIAHIETREDFDDVGDELVDRYGDPPKPCINLLYVSLMRNLAANARFTKIEHRGNIITLFPERIDFKAWSEISEKYKGAFLLSASSKPTVIYRERKGYDALEIITEMLTDYNKLILQYSSEKEG
ncbi:MAG: transcription-repair coupling factor [Ruminococcaceae bacterium]|nr:transcription-repair coupling factor [Oscillospiraceae bacterium]